jgi:hypothetical protein
MGETLERLRVPPEDPDFFERLRGAMQEQDRASARRWRKAAGVLAVVAAAALGSTAVVAATREGGGGPDRTVDRTLSCAVGVSAGRHRIAVSGAVAGPNDGLDSSGSLDVLTSQRPGATSSLLPAFAELVGDKGVQFDTASLCRGARRIPLSRAKLPSAGVVTPTLLGSAAATCRVTSRVLVRLRATLNASGHAVKAALAVRDEAKDRAAAPIAYLIWRPKRVTVFFSPRCDQR